jgi:hypothetical protein
MAESPNIKPDQYETSVTQAVEYLRGNVKWTLVAFGAIGTTLLAGSQLSNLGKFQPLEPRLWFAVACAVLALGAASYAVRSALKVAYSGYTELYGLTQADIDYVQHNAAALLEGYANFNQLKLAYEQSIATRHAELTAPLKNEEALISNEIWFGYLDGLIRKVLSYVRYNNIRQQAAYSRRELTFASVVAAAALVGFAWAANPKADQSVVVIMKSPASQAALTLTELGKQTLAPILGADCVTHEPINVIVLSLGAAESDLISLKTKDCALARFTIKDTLGKLSAASP